MVAAVEDGKGRHFLSSVAIATTAQSSACLVLHVEESTFFLKASMFSFNEQSTWFRSTPRTVFSLSKPDNFCCRLDLSEFLVAFYSDWSKSVVKHMEMAEQNANDFA